MGCFNSIVINASAEEVWNAIKNFHQVGWAPNVVVKLEKVGDKVGSEVGSKRVLNDAFHETLLSLDEANKHFTYSIDDGPGPTSKDNVEGYVGDVKVFPVTANNTAYVKWSSSWKSSVEGGVADFCNPIYHALLNDMKASLEK